MIRVHLPWIRKLLLNLILESELGSGGKTLSFGFSYPSDAESCSRNSWTSTPSLSPRILDGPTRFHPLLRPAVDHLLSSDNKLDEKHGFKEEE